MLQAQYPATRCPLAWGKNSRSCTREVIRPAINNAAEDGTEFDNINNLSNAFREDEVVPSYSNEDILRNAPDSAQDHFLVKKRA